MRKPKVPNITYSPAIPLLGVHPKEMKTYVHQVHCTGMFVPPLLVRARN